MKRILPRSGSLGVIAFVFLIGLCWLSLARGVLVAMHWERLQDVPDWWRILLIGLRMDTIVLCGLLAIPAMLLLAWPREDVSRRVALVLFTMVIMILVHMELSTPTFIAQYDTRPNRIYYEYLKYPREVFGTLLKAYPLQLIGLFVMVGLLTYAFYRVSAQRLRSAEQWSWSKRLLCLPVVLALLFIGARSSLDHRPANLSSAAFSQNHLANELAVSSTYSLLAAIYMGMDEVGADMYGRMEWAEAERRVQRYVQRSPRSEVAAARTPNLVIVVLESVGAGYVGALGGLPLTPHLDRLSREGLWFTQMYATGTRTVRGLEAIVTGYPPSAAQSVLKRPESQREFFTLGALLQQRGYRTDFIYGGASHFDEMGRFFRQNGFERIIDQKDYERPTFVGTWGVSDEDLVTKAHETFLAHGSEPFFGLVLTSSNHDPYEFPQGRIELHEQPAATRNNTVKYTDHAVGKLVELARSAPYGRDTLFLIVADHDSRVYGADLVPIERFRIPALLIGPGVPRREDARVASQIDLAPTLLGLMGIHAEHPMIGRDLMALSPDVPGRALMQYGTTNAFLVGDTAVIHQPHQAARTFAYHKERLVPATSAVELEQDALAHLVWADVTYREHRYRLPASAAVGPRTTAPVLTPVVAITSPASGE